MVKRVERSEREVENGGREAQGLLPTESIEYAEETKGKDVGGGRGGLPAGTVSRRELVWRPSDMNLKASNLIYI